MYTGHLDILRTIHDCKEIAGSYSFEKIKQGAMDRFFYLILSDISAVIFNYRQITAAPPF
jgi:hypothetical protein